MSSKRNINPKEICDQIKKGSITALSKAITLSESNIDSDQELANKILAKLKNKNNDSIRIGITGVPGAGKSTFIESFGNHITDLGLKLAVLTIDPLAVLLRVVYWEIRQEWKHYLLKKMYL